MNETNDFTLNFRLKQHTPLIHFQHHQDGAGLRATEVKPRLDTFIIEEMTQLQGDEARKAFKEQHEDWLVGAGVNEHVALDYQLTISCKTETEYLIGSSVPNYIKKQFQEEGIQFITGAPYFADNEFIKKQKLDEAKRGLMFEQVEMEIFSFHTDLITKVNQYIDAFFCYHNFGMRQSKGFGCFTLSYMNVDEFEAMLDKHSNYGNAYVYRFNRQPNLEQAFKTIDKEYKILKSGERGTNSQLKEYFEEEDIEWENPTIKKELIQGRGLPQKSDYSEDDSVKYIRALLGVAELYEFPQDRKKVDIKCVDEDAEGNTLERFKSPIMFKVFEKSIYMLYGEIDKRVFDRKFSFKTKKGEIFIRTPKSSKDFDLGNFIYNHRDNNWECLK